MSVENESGSPRRSLSTLPPPSLPSIDELRGSFKHDPRTEFWYLKQYVKKLAVDDGDEGEEFRKNLEPIANGFGGHYHQTKLAEIIYRAALEDDCQPLLAKGEKWIGEKMNVARAKASDLLSLTKRREQARITDATNGTGN
jgi:hypothetical protein